MQFNILNGHCSVYSLSVHQATGDISHVHYQDWTKAHPSAWAVQKDTTEKAKNRPSLTGITEKSIAKEPRGLSSSLSPAIYSLWP